MTLTCSALHFQSTLQEGLEMQTFTHESSPIEFKGTTCVSKDYLHGQSLQYTIYKCLFVVPTDTIAIHLLTSMRTELDPY